MGESTWLFDKEHYVTMMLYKNTRHTQTGLLAPRWRNFMSTFLSLFCHKKTKQKPSKKNTSFPDSRIIVLGKNTL